MTVTRRLFMKDLGKLGVAMVVISACDSNAVTDPVSSSSSLDVTTTSTLPPSTTSSLAAPPTSVTAEGSTKWARVALGNVSAYILARGGEAVIVDTGRSGSAPQIAESLTQLGLGWSDVSHVVATHLHGDHVGSFAAVMDEAAGAIGYAGTADVPAISSPRPMTGLEDGATVFDLRVIATPGHTPGHICVLDEAAGILVAGDALNGTDGSSLTGPNPQFTPDMDLADASVAALAGFDYSVVLVGHGEPVLDGGSGLVQALVTG